MFDKLTIRTKLIAMVAAPLAVLILLAGSGSVQRRNEASSTRADAIRLEATSHAIAGAQALQDEGLATVGLLVGQKDVTKADLSKARDRTDAAISTFQASVVKMATSNALDQDMVGSVRRQLGFVGDIRTQVDAGKSSWYELADQYFQIENTVLQTTRTTFGSEIHDPTLAIGMQSLSTLTAYKSAVAHVGIVATGVLANGSFAPPESASASGRSIWAEFQKLADQESIALGTFTASASAETRSAERYVLSGAAVTSFEAKVESLRGAADGDKVTGDAVAFRKFTQTVLEKLRGLEVSTQEGLLKSASAQANSASQSSRLYVAGALLGALLCIALAIFVASSITRPLSKLTVAVDQVAKEQLPKLVESLRSPTQEDVSFLAASVPKIDVGGGVELVHLGLAVDSIQQVAVEVATEQASLLRKGIGDMFVNLARRNQTLLDRQIEFIDELEAEEEDPDHLEGLYKLDHMATRMRRNAESLLVLAGAEPTRRRGRPVPLGDVVRAALGEVEDYVRIDLLGLDPVLVKSTAALDLAHLLSELMENATHFSPPDTRVEVVGHRTKSDGYVVSITDHGIGMTPEQMAESNEMLARPPLVGLAMSRSLGFIVIGRLAGRFGVNVRLMPSPTGGVTAVVVLPSDVVNDMPPVADDQAPLVDHDDASPLASVTPISGATSRSESESSKSESIDTSFEYTAFDQADGRSNSNTQAVAARDPFDQPTGDLNEDPSTDELYRHDELAPRARAIDPATVSFGGPAPTPTPAPEPEPAAANSPAVESINGEAASTSLPSRGSTPAGPGIPTGPERAGPGLFGGGGVSAAPTGPVRSAPTQNGPEALPSGPEELPGSSAPNPGGGLPTPVGEQPPTATAPAPVSASGLFSPAPAVAGPPVGSSPSGGAQPASAGPRLFATPTSGAPSTGAAASSPSGEVTAAGLVRRKPAGGANAPARRLPGSDGGTRNVTTTQRSPDQVRSMLSSFRSGQQNAAKRDRAPAASGAPSEPSDAPVS